MSRHGAGRPKVFRTHVRVEPGYDYLYLLACVESWDEFRRLCAEAGFQPPSGKPDGEKAVPREERELASLRPGVLLVRDMDNDDDQWRPARP